MRSLLFFIIAFLFTFPVMAEPLKAQSAATTLIVLLAVIALILGIAKVINRLKLPSMGLKSGIRLVSQMPLGQKERILLLEVNDEHLLVGVTSQQINLIKKLDSKLELQQLSENKVNQQNKERDFSENIC